MSDLSDRFGLSDPSNLSDPSDPSDPLNACARRCYLSPEPMTLHSRIKRINEELRSAIAMILLTELKDPRLGQGLVTVNQVAVSKDLHNAQIWVSVLGPVEAGQLAVEALNHSKGFIKRLLRERVVLKYMPELHFRLDTSPEYAAHINELLHKVAPHEEPHEETAEEDSETEQ